MDNETLSIITELASNVTLTSVLAYLMFFHLRESKRLSDSFIEYLKERIDRIEKREENT